MGDSYPPPFHQTIMGQKFYEATVPRLIEQLNRLNDNLEKFLEAGKKKHEPLTVVDLRPKKEKKDGGEEGLRAEDRRVHGSPPEVQEDGGSIPEWRSGC